MKKTWQKLFILFLVFMMCVSVVAVFSFTPSDVQAAPGIVWEPTQQTFTSFNKTYPVIATSTSQIYFAWTEKDASNIDQLWTAQMEIDGTSFSATKRTSGTNNCYYPDIDLDGSNVYISWAQQDGVNFEIYVARMDLDSSNWSEIYNTNLNLSFPIPRIDANGTKIYLSYTHSNNVYTASLNTDGSGFSTTQQTSVDINNSPEIKFYNNKLYVTWKKYISAGNVYKTMLATADTDSTNWNENALEIATWSGFQDQTPEIDISNSGQIAITDIIYNGSTYDLYLGEVNSSLDGWDNYQLVGSASNSGALDADLSIYNNTIYYVWTDYDDVASKQELHTATLDIDDHEWRPTVRRESPPDGSFLAPRIITNLNASYFTWYESDGSYQQIWTAIEDNTDIIEDSTYVSASVPTTLTFTSTPVTSGTPCPNSGGNADFSTTGSAVNFGNYTGGEDRLGCQEISVTTNATDGYVTTMQIDQALTNSTSDEMDSFAGSSGSANTWTTPEVWTSPVAPNDSYFGWTTDDITDYPKFGSSKYAAFVANETPYEVATESGPVVAETNYITFRLEVGVNQEAGIYTGSVMYITTATY